MFRNILIILYYKISRLNSIVITITVLNNLVVSIIVYIKESKLIYYKSPLTTI
jgi:hypothetical protein